MTAKISLPTRLVLVIAVVAGVFGTYFYLQRNVLQQQLVSVADIGGPFRLASSRGEIVDSHDLVGKPYGVFFGYTHCPEVCPTTLYEMSQALSTLGNQAKDFRLFFVTVDPERDTAPKLKDYLSNFDPRIEALVPSSEELLRIAKSFRVFYQKVPESDGGYSMDHTATLFLFGRDGQFVSTIAYGENAEARLAKLKRLMASS